MFNKCKILLYSFAILMVMIFVNFFYTVNALADGDKNSNIISSVNSYKNLKLLFSDFNKTYLDNDFDEDTLVPTLTYSNIDNDVMNKCNSIISDGEYIFRINKNSIEIVKVLPCNEMMIANTIDFGDEFSPTNMYVNDNKLYVIGNYSIHQQVFEKKIVKTYVFDVSNKDKIINIRTFEVYGNYVASRIVDSKLYVITNELTNYYSIKKGENLVPKYRDSILNDEYNELDLSNIDFIPNFSVPNYLIISSMDLTDIDSEIQFYSCIGTGNNIYVSDKNVYAVINSDDCQNTSVYKFALNDEKAEFEAFSDIKGNIINQFSINEYDSYLRIAASIRDEDTKSISNRLYILDNELKVVGELYNIADGQEIKTVKFMSDNVFFSTFEERSPVYIINVAEPCEPKKVGSTNIPVLSSYMYQYDKNHFIGIGYEKEDMFEITSKGDIEDLGPLENGMKLSMYTIDDSGNISEKFSYKIGDSGTYSEVLNNCEAIYFSNKDNLLALPVSIFKRGDSGESKFDFQGVYVFNIDPQNGIKLKGNIINIDRKTIESENYHNVNDEIIQKIFCIRDNLFTISNNKVAAYDIESLEENMHINIDKYINIKKYIKFKRGCLRLNDVFLCKSNITHKGKDYFIEFTEKASGEDKWNVDIKDSDIIALKNDKVFELGNIKSNYDYVKHVWRFKALKSGDTKIIFRSTDKNNNNTIEFIVHVDN
ncbi:beta propeller domain protein [Clostridium tepidiprofundi DSM 19306]|uniref:Beta propeller domain protein n=1 Tax=Clostridium tepidiprofundi DSM 19306 TaxID=1121338 RepID=A0A151B6H3_9CLOT|nr:beta-propeller domain-containing protein [Clostridium tepidiprofundi]KYH35352.1 beta propeller domain protein [Clostridium tepidiprofundi DSM 19306]